MKKVLKKLGLSPNETKLYLAALKSEAIDITSLAKLAGMKRTTAYSSVENLKSLGLITEGKTHNQKIYKANNPEVLLELAKSNEKKWQSYRKELEKTLPKLRLTFNQKYSISKARVYEDIKNIWDLTEELFQDIKKYRVVYQIGDSEKIYKTIGNKLFSRKLTHRRRQIKNSKIYVISDSFPEEWKRTSNANEDFRELRILSEKLQPQSVIIICGNKVWIFKITKPYMGVVIGSREITELIKYMWQFIWNNLTTANSQFNQQVTIKSPNPSDI